MRFHHILIPVFGFVLLSIVPAAAQSPQASVPQNTTTPAQSSSGAQSTPEKVTVNPPAATASPASANPVTCEMSSHEGQLISLRQCVSQHEAIRRRFQQQQSFREFQMQSLTQSPR